MQQLAVVHIDDGRYSEALEMLRQALAMNEEAMQGAMAPLMRATVGYALLRSGRPADALVELRAASAHVGSGSTEACQIDLWHHVAATESGSDEEGQDALARAYRRLSTIREDLGRLLAHDA